MKSQDEAIEMPNNQKETRKFYQKIKRLPEGCKTGASFYKDKNGNLVTDVKSTLNIWRAHFDQLLNGDDGNNFTGELTSRNPNPIYEHIEEVITPDLDKEEVGIAIKRL